MILIPQGRARQLVVAWTLLGVCSFIGCSKTSALTEQPPDKVSPKIKRLQDIKAKTDAARK